jgi:hypothetical protein
MGAAAGVAVAAIGDGWQQAYGNRQMGPPADLQTLDTVLTQLGRLRVRMFEEPRSADAGATRSTASSAPRRGTLPPAPPAAADRAAMPQRPAAAPAAPTPGPGAPAGRRRPGCPVSCTPAAPHHHCGRMNPRPPGAAGHNANTHPPLLSVRQVSSPAENRSLLPPSPFCVRLANQAQCARGLRPAIAQPRVRLAGIVCLGI